MKGWRQTLLILPAAALIFLFIMLPYINVLVMSFRTPATGTPYGEGFTLASYGRLFSDGYYGGALVETLILGIVTAVLCLAMGYPLALQIARAPRRWRGLLQAIVLSPLLVGIVARSYGWTIILGKVGVINATLKAWGLIEAPLPLMYNRTGILIGLAHVFLPFMVLPILSALQAIDPSVPSAARSLGASRWTVFRRVTFPLSMPGVQSGVILVFVLAVSAYVTPALLGGMRVKTMTVTVVDTLVDQFQWPFGSALALSLALSAGLIVLVFSLLTRVRWK